jgi:dimethylargininase
VTRGVALVRPPSARLAEGIVTHVERRPVDVERAGEQWLAYLDAIHDAGWEVLALEPDESPDSVFVEDVLVVRDGVVVLTRPGAPERRAELAGAERALAQLGLEPRRIEAPATLDGGDVLQTPDAVYVGVGGRTNADGARQLGQLLGAPILPVRVDGMLHLKTGAGVLPDGSLVTNGPLADRALGMPEPSGAQVLALDARRVLLAADCPRSAELLAARGFEPVLVDISEFQKLEGCVTCLSVLLTARGSS